MNSLYHTDPPELLHIAKTYMKPGDDLARWTAALRDAYFVGIEHGLVTPFDDSSDYQDQIDQDYAEYLRSISGGKQ